MKNSFLFALFLLVASGLACSAQTAEELGISKRSAFNDSTERRDPFVPIGWQRPPSVPAPSTVKGATPAVVVTTESYIRPEVFVVSSISVDRIPLAVINGKAYGEGESFPFLAGEKRIKLQIYAIRDGVVTLRYNDYKINCPIRFGQKPEPARKP